MSICWNSCGGIGRKCAFYNGFTGSVPTKFMRVESGLKLPDAFIAATALQPQKRRAGQKARPPWSPTGVRYSPTTR